MAGAMPKAAAGKDEDEDEDDKSVQIFQVK